jgi:hypothetical protein
VGPCLTSARPERVGVVEESTNRAHIAVRKSHRTQHQQTIQDICVRSTTRRRVQAKNIKNKKSSWLSLQRWMPICIGNVGKMATRAIRFVGSNSTAIFGWPYVLTVFFVALHGIPPPFPRSSSRPAIRQQLNRWV